MIALVSLWRELSFMMGKVEAGTQSRQKVILTWSNVLKQRDGTSRSIKKIFVTEPARPAVRIDKEGIKDDIKNLV